MQEQTIIRQFSKDIKISENLLEFYEMVFHILYSLIDTNMPINMKLMFVSHLLSVNGLLFYKNVKGDLVNGRVSRYLTYDSNRMPIDIAGITEDGVITNLIPSEYVLYYNPIPLNYLNLKIREISEIEKIIRYRRKLYKVPVIFKSKDAKILRSIKTFIRNIFDVDNICTVTPDKAFTLDQLEKIDLKIDYITDKLLDENESLKEDILEILGIYKNTSTQRERVNETELIINNSLTTVNKLGLEDTLKNLIRDVNEKFKTNYYINLNINKIFNETNRNDGDV